MNQKWVAFHMFDEENNLIGNTYQILEEPKDGFYQLDFRCKITKKPVSNIIYYKFITNKENIYRSSTLNVRGLEIDHDVSLSMRIDEGELQ